jgi:hypothetical protein
VFERGGFDLQLGNPPWVRPVVDMDALLAEGDPWWQLALKPSEAQRKEVRESTLALDGMQELVLDGVVDVEGTNEFLGAVGNYPRLVGMQTDLYRCFMSLAWGSRRRTKESQGSSTRSHTLLIRKLGRFGEARIRIFVGTGSSSMSCSCSKSTIMFPTEFISMARKWRLRGS